MADIEALENLTKQLNT